MTVQRGIYQHYKGQRYQVFGEARHSETEESMVVYQCLYGDYGLWVRPAAMFAETVQWQNRQVLRFTLVQPLP